MTDPADTSRRFFLQNTTAATALTLATVSLGAPAPGPTSGPTPAPTPAPESVPPLTQAPSSDSRQLLELSAGEAVLRISHGEMTAERYAETLLARCESMRALNAFITLDPARVLEAARACDQYRSSGGKPGPLFGLPIPVKDSVNTQDYPTTAGTPALRHFQPSADAPIVKSLRAAGAIVLGKTNLHELSYGWTSNNLAFGAVHNPYDRRRIPGGSSGGTAVAIAARMAPLGVAEDTEGSIRVPAAMCGICGFRPSTGRYSTRGCVPISPLFDQVGPHARTVADLALFDSVAANDWRPLESAPLQGLRLGVVRDFWFTGLDQQVERLTAEALQRLRRAGAQLVETELPGLQRLIELTTDAVQNHDVRVSLGRYLEEYGTQLTFEQVVRQASPDIRSIFRSDVLPGGPNFVSEDNYAAARDIHLPALRRLYRNYFERTGVAAIVFPVTLAPAPLIGEDVTVDIQGRKIPFFTVVGRNIAPGSTAGLPGLVLPAGLTTTHLPVGIELDGPSGSDRMLLAIGSNIERALGPFPTPPA
jgi:Asp-tRNA(Asn)/Glu-tRNA(Gln) amidotransferase A subunit family amidase